MEGFWETIRSWFAENLATFAITKVYIACAVAGGAVMIGQTGLNLFGLGGDHDVDPDTDVDTVDGGDGLHFISIRTLASFLTFFGLVGWGGASAGWSAPAHASAALAAGLSVMLMVAVILRWFYRMASDGTQQPEKAVGQHATVYLRIPGKLKGKGKVTVSLQGRTVELDATTAGPELATGKECRVERLITPGTVEVVPLD